MRLSQGHEVRGAPGAEELDRRDPALESERAEHAELKASVSTQTFKRDVANSYVVSDYAGRAIHLAIYATLRRLFGRGQV